MTDKSPAFSSFRKLMDSWDAYCCEADGIEKVTEDENICFYFEKDNAIYGSTEEGRLIFAKMKHPDKEDGKAWLKDASFTAMDLTKAVKGEKTQKLFYVKDVKTIKVVSKEEAFKKLK